MAWWVWALVYIGTTLIGGYIARSKLSRPTYDPAALSEFNVPTATEGTPIPLVYGTCHLQAPIVVWYGDFGAYAHVESERTFWGWTNTFTGYKYTLGMQLVLCSGPIDKVLHIRWDDELVGPYTKTENTDYTDWYYDAEYAFGGDDGRGEGGLKGNIRVYLGTGTQVADEYLDGLVGDPWAAPNPGLPAYRGICYAVLHNVYVGMSPYLRNLSFIVRRCPNALGFTAGEENIDGDANPAAMIYDILTGPKGTVGLPRYGLGIPEAMIDADSFVAAGQRLAQEGLGLSMVFDSPMSGRDAIRSILDHIDGALFFEPRTGLLTLSLIRANYKNPLKTPTVELAWDQNFGEEGTGDGKFKQPRSCCESAQHIYISDYNSHRVQVLTNADPPVFAAKFGTEGTGDGQLKFPWGIDCDDTYLYVGEGASTHRISVFLKASPHTFIRHIGAANIAGSVRGLCVHKGAYASTGLIYACCTNEKKILVFQKDGTYVGEFAPFPEHDADYQRAEDIALSADGAWLYAACAGSTGSASPTNCIAKFQSGSPYTRIWKYGSRGSNPPAGTWQSPNSVAAARLGGTDVIVVGSGVSAVAPAGNFVTVLVDTGDDSGPVYRDHDDGTGGAAADGFLQPNAGAVLGGKVFVAETGYCQLKLYALNGLDFEIDELLTLDESNCTLRAFSRPALTTLPNVVRVNYLERKWGGGF